MIKKKALPVLGKPQRKEVSADPVLSGVESLPASTSPTAHRVDEPAPLRKQISLKKSLSSSFDDAPKLPKKPPAPLRSTNHPVASPSSSLSEEEVTPLKMLPKRSKSIHAEIALKGAAPRKVAESESSSESMKDRALKSEQSRKLLITKKSKTKAKSGKSVQGVQPKVRLDQSQSSSSTDSKESVLKAVAANAKVNLRPKLKTVKLGKDKPLSADNDITPAKETPAKESNKQKQRITAAELLKSKPGSPPPRSTSPPPLRKAPARGITLRKRSAILLASQEEIARQATRLLQSETSIAMDQVQQLEVKRSKSSSSVRALRSGSLVEAADVKSGLKRSQSSLTTVSAEGKSPPGISKKEEVNDAEIRRQSTVSSPEPVVIPEVIRVPCRLVPSIDMTEIEATKVAPDTTPKSSMSLSKSEEMSPPPIKPDQPVDLPSLGGSDAADSAKQKAFAKLEELGLSRGLLDLPIVETLLDLQAKNQVSQTTPPPQIAASGDRKTPPPQIAASGDRKTPPPQIAASDNRKTPPVPPDIEEMQRQLNEELRLLREQRNLLAAESNQPVDGAINVSGNSTAFAGERGSAAIEPIRLPRGERRRHRRKHRSHREPSSSSDASSNSSESSRGRHKHSSSSSSQRGSASVVSRATRVSDAAKRELVDRFSQLESHLAAEKGLLQKLEKRSEFEGATIQRELKEMYANFTAELHASIFEHDQRTMESNQILKDEVVSNLEVILKGKSDQRDTIEMLEDMRARFRELVLALSSEFKQLAFSINKLEKQQEIAVEVSRLRRSAAASDEAEVEMVKFIRSEMQKHERAVTFGEARELARHALKKGRALEKMTVTLQKAVKNDPDFQTAWSMSHAFFVWKRRARYLSAIAPKCAAARQMMKVLSWSQGRELLSALHTLRTHAIAIHSFNADVQRTHTNERLKSDLIKNLLYGCPGANTIAVPLVPARTITLPPAASVPMTTRPWYLS